MDGGWVVDVVGMEWKERRFEVREAGRGGSQLLPLKRFFSTCLSSGLKFSDQ